MVEKVIYVESPRLETCSVEGQVETARLAEAPQLGAHGVALPICLGRHQRAVEAKLVSLPRVARAAKKFAYIDVVAGGEGEVGDIDTHGGAGVGAQVNCLARVYAEVEVVEPRLRVELHAEFGAGDVDICRVSRVEKSVAPAVYLHDGARKSALGRDGVEIETHGARRHRRQADHHGDYYGGKPLHS